MILHENHEIHKLHQQLHMKPSPVPGLEMENPADLQIPAHCCQKCGNCPEQSDEQPKTGSFLPTDDTYTGKASVSIRGLQHVFDIVDAEDIFVTYTLDIDARSWGIKGIDCIPKGEVEVRVACTKYGVGDEGDKEFDRTFKVDLSKLKVQYDAAQVIAPSEVELYIGPDHEVLYSRSTVTFHYLSVAV